MERRGAGSSLVVTWSGEVGGAESDVRDRGGGDSPADGWPERDGKGSAVGGDDDEEELHKLDGRVVLGVSDSVGSLLLLAGVLASIWLLAGGNTCSSVVLSRVWAANSISSGVTGGGDDCIVQRGGGGA